MCQNYSVTEYQQRLKHGLYEAEEMTKLESYWLSNRDWIKFTKNGAVPRENAPKEAKESYKKYLQQLKDKMKSI